MGFEREIASAEEEAKRIINESIKVKTKKRGVLRQRKYQKTLEHEREMKERRAELQKQERRLQQKEKTWIGKPRRLKRKRAFKQENRRG